MRFKDFDSKTKIQGATERIPENQEIIFKVTRKVANFYWLYHLFLNSTTTTIIR